MIQLVIQILLADGSVSATKLKSGLLAVMDAGVAMRVCRWPIIGMGLLQTLSLAKLRYWRHTDLIDTLGEKNIQFTVTRENPLRKNTVPCR
jgi:ribonuclease PH